ncbi:MAG TPA: putative glycoside hydrolase, partial [Terriglobales bacterium]|nr:putative glycoside hydrolase [Terriglobales bacterium]
MLQHPVSRHFAALLALFLVACALLRSGKPLSSLDRRATGAEPAVVAQPFSTLIPEAASAPPAAPPAPPRARPAAPAETRDEALLPDQHRLKRGESLTSVARAWISRTSYMTVPELEAALREANGLKDSSPRPGDLLTIPGFEGAPVVDKPVARPRDFEVRAIYLTGVMAGSDNGIRLIRRWRQAGGNAIVFDIKDSDGTVNVPFQHELVGNRHVAIRNLPKFIRFLHQNSLHAIARIALFRDENIAQRHPELAVRSRRTGEPWRENGKLVWADPSHPEVQDYDLALAKYVASSGADEIQFDYVRFPAEGDQKDAQFAFEKSHPGWKRSDVITDFLARAYKAL